MSIGYIKVLLATALCVLIPLTSFAMDIKTTVTKDSLIKKKQSESNKYLTAKQAYDIARHHAERSCLLMLEHGQKLNLWVGRL